MESFCLKSGCILLPPVETDWTRWACVACDQFTSQPEYWEEVENLVGQAPSAYRLILPECRLDQASEEIPRIHSVMKAYENFLVPGVEDGLILTCRTTQSGARLGLVCLLDLEQYEYQPGSSAPIRATEETIQSRIPARMRIRAGASLETSHVLLLMNEKENRLLPELHAHRENLRPVYDFELMHGGGSISGWALEDKEQISEIFASLSSLKTPGGLLFAVGDGNHSLASAKAWWEEVKSGLTREEQETHPARFALVELVNIQDPAMRFAPIHRVLFQVKPEEFLRDWREFEKQWEEGEPTITCVFASGEEKLYTPSGKLPVGVLQRWLDQWLVSHPTTRLDYVHGDETAARLGRAPDSLALLLPVPEAGSLFDGVEQFGSLPRKTFSMGQAEEKRYYLECRRIIW